MGQSLNPADFLTVGTVDTFNLKQQGGSFNLADIDRAVVTMTSSQVEEPVQASLTKADIANGWSFLFKEIPAGNAGVTLKILNRSGDILFEENKEVTVVENAITPVDFIMELDNPTSGCQQGACTGNIKVSVRAITRCLGTLKHPAVVNVDEGVLFSMENLQGLVEVFTIDFGDGSPKQTIASFPVRHTYQQPGRYQVITTLDGSGCKNPFSASSYVTIGSGK